MDDSFSTSPLPPPPKAPPVTLYDAGTVGLATFLGSPFAGCVIMAMNFHRMGSSAAAVVTILLGLLATTAIIAAAAMLPNNAAALGLSVGGLVATFLIAKQTQGPVIELHRLAGGKIGSGWMAAAVALLVVAVGVIGIVAYEVLVPPLEGTRLVIGRNDEIFYSGRVTEDEAKALGRQLQEIGYFTNRGVTTKFARGEQGTVLGFVVNDGVWNDPLMVRDFEVTVRGLAPVVGGLPIKIQLMDAETNVKKEWEVR